MATKPPQDTDKGKIEEETNGLEWESFDFAESPKWDPRFLPKGSKGLSTIFDDMTDGIVEEECRQDELLAEEQREKRESLLGLSPALVQKCLKILQPYVQDQRCEKIESVLRQRTKQTQFLFVSTCLVG